MDFFMGVDAGGSKTYSLIADASGKVVGRGRAGNGNHQINLREAKRNIASACSQALEEAGLAPGDLAFAYFGLAGADREPDYKILRPMIAGLAIPRHAITCDTMIAMRAGSSRPYGAVVISGTGFNAAARNRAGDELQYGGFGFMFGDGHGSGRGLANLAFRSAVRAWDGRGKPTLLHDLVLERTGFAGVPDMLDAALDAGYEPPLHLAELMFRAAAQGDEVASAILAQEGAELGNAAAALIRRLGMAGEEFEVVLGGSVLAKSAPGVMHEALAEPVRLAAPNARVVQITMEPVAGAVLSAMDHAGYRPGPAVLDRLRNISYADLKGDDVK
ncbi:BadF/BadG/BcrA/BcrD ATPase family protein [Paenibacillus sp. M1]|uniref:BadF/BadG/BcrA/BcrD ATPase family protein n=1 Tax=Paenibacillus haidiansis TaxID=1574488 RepID=A0ABU7VPC3_9BACL